MALIWAAGIIWFALSVADPGDPKSKGSGGSELTDVTGAPVKDKDVKKLEGILKGL